MFVNWNFDNTYLKLPENFYSFVKADNFPKPKIACSLLIKCIQAHKEDEWYFLINIIHDFSFKN